MKAAPIRRESVAVLGGGVLGLTVALRLAQAGKAVTVYEASSSLGGLAATFEIRPGLRLERFYHHLFTTDRAAQGLLEDLGLRDQLIWAAPSSVSYVDGRFYPLDSAWAVLRFSPLPPLDRVHLGVGVAALRVMPRPWGLGDRTVATVLPTLMGTKAFELVWKPLLRGKFHASACDVAASWFWARIHDRSQRLGYLRGGFATLYDRLTELTLAAGARILLSTRVEAVERVGSTFTVTAHSLSEPFDLVVSTLPPNIAKSVLPDHDDIARRYPASPSLSAHCLVLELDRSLLPAYWVNVHDPASPFVAAVEHTRFMSPAWYDGSTIVYLGSYVENDDPVLTAPLQNIMARFAPWIRRLNPAFSDTWIKSAWSFGAPYAQPIVGAGYERTIMPGDAAGPGISIANMFQVYPHDRGQNYSIALAEHVAHQILAS